MNPAKKPFLSRKHYAGEDFYEKTASKYFFSFFVLGFFFLVFSIWFIVECYRGWNVFSL